ncbi:ThiF family adenylyltransferase [Aeromonas enteropelogenes]|uniref:ThiF family adenylyltransferase n=1 Tax=Aeromonas enteropelogenes TaxID=29489 RepID=UPI003F74548B
MSKIADWIIEDIKKLKTHPNISEIECDDIDESNQLLTVSFLLSYDLYGQVIEKRLHNPEKVKLLYINTEIKMAPSILSGRIDFPKDLPHLNPVPSDMPASICLWRKGGSSSLYMHKGIIETINILSEWFVDASLGALQKDGWEPTPRSGSINIHLNPEAIQEIVYARKGYNKAFKISSHGYLLKDIKSESIVGYIKIGSEISPIKNYKNLLRESKYENVCELNVCILSPNENEIESIHNAMQVSTLDDLSCYSKNAIVQQFVNTLKRENDARNDKHAVIICCHRRPLPLIEDIPNLSRDTEKRKIELVAFYLECSNGNYKLVPMSIHSESNSELLSTISGAEYEDRTIGIVGCGAIGSTLSDQLARSGHKTFLLWDGDYYLPHNNARHVLIHNRNPIGLLIGQSKALMLSEHIESISSDIKVYKFPRKFINEDIIIEQYHPNHIFDTTGEDLEYQWLNRPNSNVSRVFIADEGRLGFLQTQAISSNEDMLDLEAFTYLSSSYDLNIHDWLHRQSSLSNQMLGFSCSSTTLAMPWSTVINHVSALVPSIRKVMNQPEPTIIYNLLDKDGSPSSFKKIYNEKDFFSKYEIKDEDNVLWVVSISKDVRNKMLQVRNEGQGKETAGYILGLYNIEAHRISIVFASKGNFKSDTNNVELEEITKDIAVNEVLQACNNMLVPMGTWHSHPGTSAHPSNIDLQTLDLICKDRIQPTVMIIQAEQDINIIVKFGRV